MFGKQTKAEKFSLTCIEQHYSKVSLIIDRVCHGFRNGKSFVNRMLLKVVVKQIIIPI